MFKSAVHLFEHQRIAFVDLLINEISFCILNFIIIIIFFYKLYTSQIPLLLATPEVHIIRSVIKWTASHWLLETTDVAIVRYPVVAEAEANEITNNIKLIMPLNKCLIHITFIIANACIISSRNENLLIDVIRYG